MILKLLGSRCREAINATGLISQRDSWQRTDCIPLIIFSYSSHQGIRPSLSLSTNNRSWISVGVISEPDRCLIWWLVIRCVGQRWFTDKDWDQWKGKPRPSLERGWDGRPHLLTSSWYGLADSTVEGPLNKVWEWWSKVFQDLAPYTHKCLYVYSCQCCVCVSLNFQSVT